MATPDLADDRHRPVGPGTYPRLRSCLPSPSFPRGALAIVISSLTDKHSRRVNLVFPSFAPALLARGKMETADLQAGVSFRAYENENTRCLAHFARGNIARAFVFTREVRGIAIAINPVIFSLYSRTAGTSHFKRDKLVFETGSPRGPVFRDAREIKKLLLRTFFRRRETFCTRKPRKLITFDSGEFQYSSCTGRAESRTP